MMNGGTPILGNHHIFDSITISVYGGFRSPRDVPQACWMVDFMENSNLIPSPVHTKHPSLWSQWNVEMTYSTMVSLNGGVFRMNGGWDYYDLIWMNIMGHHYFKKNPRSLIFRMNPKIVVPRNNKS